MSSWEAKAKEAEAPGRAGNDDRGGRGRTGAAHVALVLLLLLHRKRGWHRFGPWGFLRAAQEPPIFKGASVGSRSSAVVPLPPSRTDSLGTPAGGRLQETQRQAMGKSKSKGQKQMNVFHVANKKITKVKSKAKPVTTSLKKVNIMNDEKVNLVNKVFTEVQKEVKQLSKAVSLDSPKQHQIPKPLEDEPVNVDVAANLMSQL